MTERRYTQAELLAEARALGHEVHPKLVERYVTLGLLDVAEQSGRGPGGGKGGHWTWPEQQLQLWLTLLHHRRRDDRVRHLINIPVWVWLHWGDDFVPLQQVRRALETWAGIDKRKAPREDHPTQARRLVDLIARPGAKPKQKAALRDALVYSWRDRCFDVDRIRELLDAVVGPDDRSAQLDGRRAFLLLQAYWAAIDGFRDLTVGHYRWARAFYLVSAADYLADRETLASDAEPRTGALHQPRDLSAQVSTACGTLLRILGMGLTVPPSKDLPEPLRLDTWLEDRASLRTRASVEQASLLVPPGAGTSEMRVEVTIDVRRPEEAPGGEG